MENSDAGWEVRLGKEGFQPEGFGFKLKASARSVVPVRVIRETGYNGNVLRSGTADTEEL